MKGEKIVTNLLPYGPEKPRLGMVKKGVEGNPGTTQIEIFWDPPRGEFTKYFLNIENVSEKSFCFDETSKFTKNTNTSNNNSKNPGGGLGMRIVCPKMLNESSDTL